MPPVLTHAPSRNVLPWLRGALLTACVTGSLLTGLPAQAQSGPTWHELSARDQHILEPLEARWNSLELTRKQKWLNVAKQYPQLNPEQQARVRERMLPWADLSIDQRSNARLHFTEVKTLPTAEKQARWEAYNALPEAERLELARKAAARQQPSKAANIPAAPASAAQAGLTAPAKTVIVGTPRTAGKAQPVGLGTVQASVGASTRPISTSPSKPEHQQAGKPKISAGPEFVDRSTLLPQRGPQGVSAPSSAASAHHR